MSIITCYARLTQADLDSLVGSGDLMSLFKTPPSGAEVIDLDKAGPVIAWLLSPCKRAEQMAFANVLAEDLGEEIPFPDPPSPQPLDGFAIAIEGRGPRKERRLDGGYGPACVFVPAEVSDYSKLLGSVDEAALRRELDFPLMDRLFLPVEYWQEEGEATFAEYILPLTQRLQSFFAQAATNEQAVVVWNM